MPSESPFSTLADVKRANAAIGHHWFDRDTLAFFKSRVSRTLYAGRYFVTSEQPPFDEPRRYSVRRANDNGSITTIGEFRQYATQAEAVAAIRLLVGDRLHYPGGAHRGTPETTDGRALELHEAAIRRHIADGHTHETADA